ncbi:MAG: hypothetical protein PHQ39_10655 [Methanothrix soehngenii]|nr:hypothetical protein [Methanothrix soehngenii]
MGAGQSSLGDPAILRYPLYVDPPLGALKRLVEPDVISSKPTRDQLFGLDRHLANEKVLEGPGLGAKEICRL